MHSHVCEDVISSFSKGDQLFPLRKNIGKYKWMHFTTKMQWKSSDCNLLHKGQGHLFSFRGNGLHENPRSSPPDTAIVKEGHVFPMATEQYLKGSFHKGEGKDKAVIMILTQTSWSHQRSDFTHQPVPNKGRFWGDEPLGVLNSVSLLCSCPPLPWPSYYSQGCQLVGSSSSFTPNILCAEKERAFPSCISLMEKREPFQKHDFSFMCPRQELVHTAEKPCAK